VSSDDVGSRCGLALNNTIPKTVLVTGAAKRIGRAIALDMATHGFSVLAHANKSVEDARQTVNEIRQKGGKAELVVADLSQLDETKRLIPQAQDIFGTIGVVVNNASLFLEDNAGSFHNENYEQHFAVHVRAPSILTQALDAQLLDGQSGLVVNVIDQRVLALTPRFYTYTLSKAALWTATQTLAQSFAPRLRVNAIGPGPSFRSKRQSPKDFQAQIDGTILARGPAPEEFGRTVRYFYDMPSVTGQLVALDGGQHLGWKTPDIAEIQE
jgi:NAD(P)-dependent dehydrogenase (short-subunit alcohol dehydrogenase family)